MSDNRKCGHFLRSSNELIELTVGAITCPWCEIAARDATIAELRSEVERGNYDFEHVAKNFTEAKERYEKAESALTAAQARATTSELDSARIEAMESNQYLLSWSFGGGGCEVIAWGVKSGLIERDANPIGCRRFKAKSLREAIDQAIAEAK